MKRTLLAAVCLASIVLAAGAARATETENLGIRVLPAKNVKIDGKIDDWDLTGGVFVCGDAETQREQYAVGFHLMYDDKYLYVLARWIDHTPLNNPGQTVGSYGFAGDCLQVRFVMPQRRFSHWDCWRGSAGKELMSVAYANLGGGPNEGGIKEARTKGAEQAFRVNPDGKGYAQEIKIPWRLLTRDGAARRAGETFRVTVEPNFTVGVGGRHTIKGIFKEGVPADRVFTFMASNQWGPATMVAKGNVAPQPVRLADERKFAVRMEKGLPVINWTGLILSNELRGFETIRFNMPADGYVSMHIKDSSGVVVRQLLNCAFYTQGDREVKWDGLMTAVWRKIGQPVSPGRYSVSAIWHKGIGLRLRGFACNGGSVPWDNGPETNWGGDHGVPSGVATDGRLMYLGWTGAEAGKALVATDFEANVKWKNSRRNMAGSPLVAAADGVTYGMNGADIYALKSGDGAYLEWAEDGSPDLKMGEAFSGTGAWPKRPSGVAAGNGRLCISARAEGLVAVLDAKSRKLLRVCKVPGPGRLCVAGKKLVYVVSDGTSVVALDPTTGGKRTVVEGLRGASGVAVDEAGRIYVGGPDNQVKVFDREGKPLRAIGKKGGRPPLGPWQPDGMLAIQGIAVDPNGKLWVAEATASPKRFSVWDTKTGKLVKELFGPTHYGASGGSINPLDPDVMAGDGCEWRIDPKSGRGRCTGVYENRHAGAAKFCVGSNGRLYLVTGSGMGGGDVIYNIFERVGEGDYRKRGSIVGNSGQKRTIFWADINGDQRQQPGELQTIPGTTSSAGAYSFAFGFNVDLTFYAKNKQAGGAVQIRVDGFTACGAPVYDLQNIKKTPVWGVASPDNKILLSGYPVQDMHEAYDLKTGKLLWKYPAPFSGVHGSHRAPPPAVGLIRGSFSPNGSALLPEPIGALWALNSNVGEWHLLTGSGFYLSRLFQADPIKVNFPDKALPGAILDNCPPGLGGEDFGGSLTQGKDGQVYVQAGKTGLWNVAVTGVETVKRLPVQTALIAITTDDVPKALALRAEFLRGPSGAKRLLVKKMTPKFTGDMKADFAGAKTIAYKKQDAAAVTTLAAWDTRFLYIGWEVKDKTPWVNAARQPEEMYVSGDTVDLQIGTDVTVDKKRDGAVGGDLRLSIGNFRGKPTAVIYRRVSGVKQPKVFSSGVVAKYRMDYVAVIPGTRLRVTTLPRKGYVVEAAIPLSALGFKPETGLKLRGDVGATHGGAGGQRTRLRTFWSNSNTGIVDDAVFELKMEPKNWGELVFE